MKAVFCASCDERLTNDEIAFNLKIGGAGCVKFYCIECMSKVFGVEKPVVIATIEELKQTGCKYFQRRYVEDEVK